MALSTFPSPKTDQKFIFPNAFGIPENVFNAIVRQAELQINEAVADTVGAMVTSNTENGISVTYDDDDNTLDFDVADFTITLGGDLSGSTTITNLGNATLNAAVSDDSHNHTSSTITGFVEDARLGISAATRDLNVGIAAVEPVPGPARTVLTAAVFHSNASVPVALAGEPDTVNKSGASREIEIEGTSSV